MSRKTGLGWLELILGIVLVLLGIYSFARPEGALTGAVICYGTVAVVTGAADILFYMKMEQHMGIGPTVSLVSGIVSIMTGLMLLICPGAGSAAVMILFPLWFLMHSISRLSHLGIVRRFAGNGFYYLSLVINILGLVIGFLMILQPVISVLTFGYLIGFYLIMLGVDSIALAVSKLGTSW